LELADYLLLAYCQQKSQQQRKRKKEKIKKAAVLLTIDFATSASFNPIAGLETPVPGQSWARLAWVSHLSQPDMDSSSSRFYSSTGMTSSRVKKTLEAAEEADYPAAAF
jgi:hypothetical protein